MKKIDPVVKKETLFVFLFSLVMSVLMQAVFLILKTWDLTVLYGNLLSLFAGTLNFLLMGLTVQSAVDKDPDDAKKHMKLSQSLRYLLLIAVAALGAALPCFNIIATLLPMFFPRIAVTVRGMTVKKGQ